MEKILLSRVDFSYTFLCVFLSREMSKGLKDLLKGLLERKVADRIGSKEEGAQELFQSEFLSSLDMEKILNKEYTPEFIPPSQRHDTDVRNFEREFTDERVSVVDGQIVMIQCVFQFSYMGIPAHVKHTLMRCHVVQAVDSVVESAMTGSMAEKTTFEGFTFKGDNKMS